MDEVRGEQLDAKNPAAAPDTNSDDEQMKAVVNMLTRFFPGAEVVEVDYGCYSEFELDYKD